MELNSYSKQETNTQSIEQSARNILFRNVYIYMTLALIITGITSLVVAFSPNLTYIVFSSKYVFYGLLLAELALVWYLSARINKLSFTTATIFFVIYSLLNGITLSFIFLIYTQSSIAMTVFVSAGTFGVMALVGTLTKKDLSSWGNILMMAVVGLIIATVVNLFWANSTLYWIITYAGVLIFVELTAYDAQ
ncbi:MAG: Bax inhibitor-1 family protein, partial [Dysgonomonas sp.]